MSREFLSPQAHDSRSDPDILVFWLIVVLYALFSLFVPGGGPGL